MLIERAKDALVKQGLCETINYAFSSQSWLDTFGMKAQTKVINPLSEEHEFLVPSLLPGLVKNAVTNFRHHFGSEKLSVRLFEVRPTFGFEGPGEPSMLNETDTGVKENWKVSLLVTGTRYQQALRAEAGEFDFYDLKAMIEGFLEAMGTKGVRFIAPDQSRAGDHPTFKILHPGQSMEILAGNATLGHFGLLHPKLSKSLKLKGSIFLAELDWSSLVKMSRAPSQARTYKPWSEFPGMERDFAFLVDQAVTAEKILGVLNKSGKPLVKQAKIFDVYQGAQVPAGKKSVAARVILQDDSRSLTEAEAEEVSKKLVGALQKELSAELR